MAENTRLRALRQQRGWSITWTAVQLGCSHYLYQKWEHTGIIPARHWLLTLCAHFACSPEEVGFPIASLPYSLEGVWPARQREGLVRARIDARELAYEVAYLFRVHSRVYLGWELGLLTPRPEQVQTLCQHFDATPHVLGFADALPGINQKT